MNTLKIISLFLLVTSNVFAFSVFGDDDRKDWYEVTDNKLKDISLSTAVKVSKKLIIPLAGKYSDYYEVNRYYANSTYGGSNKLCYDEKFHEQMDIGSCSGFLINEDTLVTAGHCVETIEDCKNSYWIFDYKMNKNDTDLRWGKKSNVYSCQKIIKRKLSRKILGFGKENNKIDYSIIKLNRSTGRRGFKISKSRVHNGQNLTLIGYPSGLPLKIASNAKVLSRKKKSFYASVDSFSGNSGSAVVDSDSLEVVGILVAGKKDFYSSDQKVKLSGFSVPYLQKCNRIKKYQTHGRNAGEVVTNIRNLFK